MMTDSNSSSSNNPFTLPHVLEFHTSASNCSLDVSVLSVDSSCSSFGSMSQLQVDRTAGRKKVHKKRPSYAKFNHYKSGGAGNVSIGGRWNNTVDAFGSAGMNTAPFRKPSYNRLSNSKLNQRMSMDVSAEMPCRKFSDNDMKLNHQKQAAADAIDGPISVPVRQDSGSVESGSSGGVSERSDNRATAALYKQFRRSSKAKNKNFQWTRTRHSTGATKGPQLLNARTCPPMVESTFTFNLPSNKPAGAPQHLIDNLRKKNPPAKPSRKGSIMEFNILNDFEAKDQPLLPNFHRKNNATMMPPPARKPSLMDFDDLSTNGSSGQLASGQVLPPLPSTYMNFNSSWSSNQWQNQSSAAAATTASMGSHSDPTNGLLGSTRTSARPQNLFLAMPPLTKFERQASTGTSATARTSLSSSPPPMPRRREGFADAAAVPGLMPMIPGPPTFNRQSSSVSQAPSVPQRKDSLMSINGDSESEL